MVCICVVSTFTDNNVLLPPSWRIGMLSFFSGEPSIIHDLETGSLFAMEGVSVWAWHAKLLQLGLEIILLPHKLAPLTSDETELPSVSNRMSLVHKHPAKPTARQNYLRWTKSVFVYTPLPSCLSNHLSAPTARVKTNPCLIFFLKKWSPMIKKEK